MAYGSLKLLAGPAYLSATAGTNIYQGGNGGSTLIYDKVEQIHLVCAATPSTVTMYLGGTGGSTGGTQIFNAFSMATNTFYDWFGLLKMISTQYITGSASVASMVVVTIMGECYVI